jgi:Rieske Fe-S protein
MKRRNFLLVVTGLIAQLPLEAFAATKKPTPKAKPKVSAKPTPKASSPTATPVAKSSATPSAKPVVTPQLLPVMREGQPIKVDSLVAPISFYGSVVKSGNEYPMLISKPTDRTIKIFSARCPHQGAILNLSKLGEFTCDRHGARYDDTSGKVLDGPTINNLEQYVITERDGLIFITL